MVKRKHFLSVGNKKGPVVHHVKVTLFADTSIHPPNLHPVARLQHHATSAFVHDRQESSSHSRGPCQVNVGHLRLLFLL